MTMARWLSRFFDSDAPPDATPAAASPSPQDELSTLAERTRELVAEINASAGHLPAEGVVLARRVTDLVAGLLVGDVSVLSTQARLELGAVVGDYLPTTLRTYVAADRSGAGAPDRLLDQVAALYRSVAEIVEAVRGQDARAFDVQDNFLSQRFSQDVL